MIIMTGVILANLPDFRSKIELDLIAQEVAVTIRQAQVYGATARDPSIDPEFRDAYGIYLLGGQDNFVFFKDKNFDSTYDAGDNCGGSSTECTELFKFRGNIRIMGLILGSGSMDSNREISINFIRPNLEANFTDESTDASVSTPKLGIVIGRTGAAGPPCSVPELCRQINVWGTGHIYVTKYP